jgi:hypothetical protein
LICNDNDDDNDDDTAMDTDVVEVNKGLDDIGFGGWCA